jgi:molecular chaperone GrpE
VEEEDRATPEGADDQRAGEGAPGAADRNAAEDRHGPGEARPPAAGKVPSAEWLAELREKAAERDEYLDLLKRARADFANYQKRMGEERRRWGLMAQRDLLARLLVASDQCRLAADSAREDSSADSLRDAICLVWAEVERFLDAAGVKRMETAGASFDPEKHEAVMVRMRDDLPDASIAEEIKPGYAFGDHVLRPAQVVVSKKPKPPEETPAEAEEVPPEADCEPGREAGGEASDADV